MSDRVAARPGPVERDRGAIDGGLEIMFGGIMIICFVLVVVEASAFWHSRNIFDEAAAEGVRVAAAFDGTCAQGRAAAADLISRRAENWADGVDVRCQRDAASGVAEIEITGHSPGILFGNAGIDIHVRESAPIER